jgi:dienelactone hydrolase
VRRRRKLAAFGATPVLLVAIVATAGHDYLRGAAFVIQAAGMQGPPRTIAEWTTDDVSESETTIPWRGGTLRGRVYAAGDASGPPALLVPGVHAGGIDEPRLIQFARDVASMGRTVVTAGLPDLERYRITPRTTDMIEDAAVWLSTQSGFAPNGRIGMMGISFAGGLSVVAAARPSLHGRVAFVMSFGGHGDLPRTLRYLCTGVQPDGSIRPPHDYGLAIILLGVAHLVVPAEQAPPLREAILAFLHASHVDMIDKPQAQIEFTRAKTLAQALDEPARTYMQYVNDRDVGRLGPILLPHATTLGGDVALSAEQAPVPSAPVYLLHGTDDNVIPAVESRLLAESIRARGGRVEQLATPLITHAEVDRSAAARATWDLVSFWAHLLAEK